MKQKKHLLKICVLLFLFVCASAAPGAFAQDDTQDAQKFGIGLKFLGGDGLNAVGFNARFWSESKLGFEAGWATDGEGGGGVSSRFHIIPFSALYTLTHVNTNSMYIRPYLGGGINITRFTTNIDDYLSDFLGEDISLSETKVGGQGFFGAEFTFKSVPRLSFGGDVGLHRIFNDNGFRAGVQVHYYLK
jgi:hypothetical protein